MSEWKPEHNLAGWQVVKYTSTGNQPRKDAVTRHVRPAASRGAAYALATQLNREGK